RPARRREALRRVRARRRVATQQDRERSMPTTAERLAWLYAATTALGLLGSDGPLIRFVTTGLTPDEYDRLKGNRPGWTPLIGAGWAASPRAPGRWPPRGSRRPRDRRGGRRRRRR